MAEILPTPPMDSPASPYILRGHRAAQPYKLRRKLRSALLLVGALVGLGFISHLLPPIFGATHLENTVVIGRSQAEVFAYVTTPANWPMWHPSSLGVTGAIGHSLEIGEAVTETFLVAGRHGEARWRVIERAAPAEWAIDGRALGSEGGAIIRYRLVADGDSTRFTRVMDYQMPNLWSDILNYLVLRDRIAAESNQAVQRLKAVLEDQGGASR